MLEGVSNSEEIPEDWEQVEEKSNIWIESMTWRRILQREAQSQRNLEWARGKKRKWP